MGNILHDFVVGVLKSEKTAEVELLKWEFIVIILNNLNFNVSNSLL